MGPQVFNSAYKHGLDHDDIMHAFNHPIRSELVRDGFVMLIGPDQSGNLLEIGIAETSEGPAVVHAMRARAKYVR